MEPLQPLGIGTAECESLSSYVQRLCWQHGGLPGQLAHRTLIWLDKGNHESVGAWATRPGRLRLGFNNNGFGIADAWARSIQRVTGRADVAQMTTRAWDYLFPTRGFMSNSLGWCPPCLEEDVEPHHRLSWTVHPVCVCLKHRLALQHLCGRCGRRPPVMHDRSHVIQCPWCRGDLRIADKSRPAVPRDHFDYWVASEIGAIIAASGQCHRHISWEPQRAISSICATHKLTAGSFARAIGTGKLTTWYWLSGKARPSLGSALRVYHRFGLSLAAALVGEAPRREAAAGARQGEIHLRSRRPPRQIDWHVIQHELRAELQQPVGATPTFLAVSQRLGIARRTLRAHEPALCRQIASRHRARVHLEAAQRAESLALEIRAALPLLRSRGLGPTWRELAAEIGRPTLFNSAYARRIVRSVLCTIP